MIGAAEVDDLIEEILLHLRPLKVSDAAAAAEVRRCMEAVDQKYSAGAGIAPLALRDLHERFLGSLTQMIEDYEALPAGSRALLMHFAPLFRTWPAIDPADRVDELSTYLRRLADLVASPAFSASDGAFVAHARSHDKAAKTVAAGWAFILMSKVSDKPRTISGGAYVATAGLLYRAVSGIDSNLKDWCAKFLRRQREHERLVSELPLDSEPTAE
jgi:hypothetical protein